ncbi:hypothetical protein C0J52_06563 [Blattella germanica]|nr:hypothetical protein C0J52_06563 [Blattella germanica]
MRRSPTSAAFFLKKSINSNFEFVTSANCFTVFINRLKRQQTEIQSIKKVQHSYDTNEGSISYFLTTMTTEAGRYQMTFLISSSTKDSALVKRRLNYHQQYSMCLFQRHYVSSSTKHIPLDLEDMPLGDSAPPDSLQHRVPILVVDEQRYGKKCQKHRHRTNVKHERIIDNLLENYVGKHRHWNREADGHGRYQRRRQEAAPVETINLTLPGRINEVFVFKINDNNFSQNWEIQTRVAEELYQTDRKNTLTKQYCTAYTYNIKWITLHSLIWYCLQDLRVLNSTNVVAALNTFSCKHNTSGEMTADKAAATTAAFERSKFSFALEFEGGGGFCADFRIIPGDGGRTSFCLRGLGAGGFMSKARSLASFFSD